MTGLVQSYGDWRNNAELIADVARLGYLDDYVLDATYGDGKFWTLWQPKVLTRNDLHKEATFNHAFDFRCLPTDWGDIFDAVVFDPPYKLAGRRDLAKMDAAYGTDKRVNRAETMALIRDGAIECYRCVKPGGYLHVKCMDQVEGGMKRWQTDLVTNAIEGVGGIKVDRFDIHSDGIPQPEGRTQRTSRNHRSTLLVFRKPKGRRKA